jgi:hypothetical protein
MSFNKQQVYSILTRFHDKFKLIRNPSSPNPNQLPESTDEISLIQVYKILCVYSNEKNIRKENLIIKYKMNSGSEIISLNLPYEEYKDLL